MKFNITEGGGTIVFSIRSIARNAAKDPSKMQRNSNHDFGVVSLSQRLEILKGIIFTEFLGMLEKEHGLSYTQEIVDSLDLDTGGAYTTVGYYPTSELVSIMQRFCDKSDMQMHDVMEQYGIYFFNSLVKHYPVFFEDNTDILGFLASIHNHIHVEVKKLYPDSRPPSLTVQRKDDSQIELLYESSRAMSDFARGLLKGSGKFFEKKISITESMLNPDGTKVLFCVSLA